MHRARSGGRRICCKLRARLESAFQRGAFPGEGSQARVALGERLLGSIEGGIARRKALFGSLQGGIALGQGIAQGAQFRLILLQFPQSRFARRLACSDALGQRLLDFPKLALLRLKCGARGRQIRRERCGPLRGRRLTLPGFLE